MEGFSGDDRSDQDERRHSDALDEGKPYSLWLWSANCGALILVGLWVGVQVVRSSGPELQISGTAKGDQVQDLLWFAFLCGLAAFATLELVKRLTRVRGLLQREAALNWFARRRAIRDFDRLLQLLSLHSRGQDARQLFDLPAEQTAAQISAAAETALLAHGEGLLPMSWLSASALLERIRDEQAKRLAHKPPVSDEENGRRGEEDDLLLAQSIRMSIDQLQIAMGDQWRRYCQGTAFVLAAVYGVGFAIVGDFDPHDEAQFIVVATIIGAAAAWVIRDLTAIVEKARR
jgi:hypothetical protein